MRLFLRPDKERWNSGCGLENCLYALGLPCSHHHDAAEDASMCAQILIAVINGQKPNWELSDRKMMEVTEERKRLSSEACAARQTKQLDMFAEVLTSTAVDNITSKHHTPTIFEKEYSDTDDGKDEVDFNRLNTSEQIRFLGAAL